MPAGRLCDLREMIVPTLVLASHTQGGARSSALPPCGQASLHSPRGLLSLCHPQSPSLSLSLLPARSPARSLARSFALAAAADDKGAAVQRATKRRDANPHPHPHPHPAPAHARIRTRARTHEADEPERRDA